MYPCGSEDFTFLCTIIQFTNTNKFVYRSSWTDHWDIQSLCWHNKYKNAIGWAEAEWLSCSLETVCYMYIPYEIQYHTTIVTNRISWWQTTHTHTLKWGRKQCGWFLTMYDITSTTANNTSGVSAFSSTVWHLLITICTHTVHSQTRSFQYVSSAISWVIPSTVRTSNSKQRYVRFTDNFWYNFVSIRQK